MKLTKHARMNARRLRRKGKSLAEIADLYGVPPQREAAKGVDRMLKSALKSSECVSGRIRPEKCLAGTGCSDVLPLLKGHY